MEPIVYSIKQHQSLAGHGKMAKINTVASKRSERRQTPYSATYKRFEAQRVSQRLDKSIKNRFDVLLARVGLSQNQLARNMGVTKGTISKIVNGDWFPSSRLMLKICRELQVDSVILFGDSEYWHKWNERTLYPKDQ